MCCVVDTTTTKHVNVEIMNVQAGKIIFVDRKEKENGHISS